MSINSLCENMALVEKEAELQQKREDALVALEEVLDAAPLEIDLPSARFMLADAEANGVTATNLAAARATIEFAEKAQSQEREAPRGDEFQMAEDMEFIREDISVG